MTLCEEDACVSHMQLSIATSCEIGKGQVVGGDNLTALAVWKLNSLKETVREKQWSKKMEKEREMC